MISILLGLLLPVIPAVKRYSRKATAKAEVKSIEAAWKLYYQEYKKWPTFADEVKIAIEDDVARTIDGTGADSNNIRRLQFMDFSRYNDATNPINPWGNSLIASTNSGYYVAFDINFDNTILSPLSNAVRRSVIVWTVNPDITDGSDERIIGSWQE